MYRAPQGYERSRIVIGAIAKFEGGNTIICCAVSEAPRRHADGTVETVTIPFLPMTETAFQASVVALDGMSELPDDFGPRLQDWSQDPKGLSAFTVPFEGHLDRMIALQMEKIAAGQAA
jgi:hypothetical protein